jgi:hypothetical protein
MWPCGWWLVDHARRARDPRGQTSDESGLRGVRVNDRRALAPDQPDQLAERGEVGARRELPPEGRNVHDPASAAARVVERRRVGFAERRGQRAAIARAGQRDARGDGVLRGAAQREPRDGVQDVEAHPEPFRA